MDRAPRDLRALELREYLGSGAHRAPARHALREFRAVGAARIVVGEPRITEQRWLFDQRREPREQRLPDHLHHHPAVAGPEGVTRTGGLRTVAGPGDAFRT